MGTNNQCDALTSITFNNLSGPIASEVGQIYCGNQKGLNFCTNTAHPIKFTTYTNQGTIFTGPAPASMQILANTTRDVEILSPLKVQSSLTTFTERVIILNATGAETSLGVFGDVHFPYSLTVVGNTTISGNLTAPNLNPYWVAVVINYTGGVPVFVRANGGRYTATNLVRISGQATGFTQFDFPAHPQGANYIISTGATATISSTRSSTRVAIITRNVQSPTVFLDAEVHVFVSAY